MSATTLERNDIGAQPDDWFYIPTQQAIAPIGLNPIRLASLSEDHIRARLAQGLWSPVCSDHVIGLPKTQSIERSHIQRLGCSSPWVSLHLAHVSSLAII
jgi:hypothetical protein